MHIRSFLACSAVTLAAIGCHDGTESPTESGPLPQAKVAAAAALAFRQVSAGSYHTCGITPEGEAYCWGLGPLGDGQGGYPRSSRPVAVAGTLRFRQVSTGSEYTCGVTTDYRAGRSDDLFISS
jgi:alpha-tubulin suppressor-like RCC1 family protein